MTVTVVTRWSTPNIADVVDLLKRAKAIQTKHGASVFRASQIYTGQFTGQLLVSIVYSDMASYANALTKGAAEMQPVFAESAKLGGVMQERVILMGLDV